MNVEFCCLKNNKQIWHVQIWTSHHFAGFLIVSNKDLLNLGNKHGSQNGSLSKTIL